MSHITTSPPYKEIQQRAKSDDSHKVNAANSAMPILELFPFFHHEGITEEIFFYAAVQKDLCQIYPLPVHCWTKEQSLAGFLLNLSIL
jgi:hypothetical protein